MVEPSTHYKPLDPGRVDTVDPVELQYWCMELHCTESELMQALSNVGEHVAALREHLASRP